MKNNRIYIILLICLFVFLIVMFLLFGINNIKEQSHKATIIVGNNTIWTLENSRWSNSVNFNRVNWNKYNVFSDNVEVGNYYLLFDDKWYIYDDNKEAVIIDGNLLAYDANYKVNILNFSNEEVNDMTYVNYVLNENKLNLSNKFTSLYKTSIDFDNDGALEEFYIMTNAFPLDFNPNYIFSIAFMVKDNTIYYIYNNISENTNFNGCKPFINSFIDINDDNKYEIILSCGKYSVSEQIDMLYKFEKDEFNLLISNQ